MSYRSASAISLSLEREAHKAVAESLTDLLIGIANWRAFNKRFAEEWEFTLRERTQLSLLLAHIDYFKGINDSLEHPQGDGMLKQAAPALKYAVTCACVHVALQGGEEFGSILPITDIAGAQALADKMLTKVRELALTHAKFSAAEHVTMSTGGCTLQPSRNQPSDLLRGADVALYRAKCSGRNRAVHQVFTSDSKYQPADTFEPSKVYHGTIFSRNRPPKR